MLGEFYLTTISVDLPLVWDDKVQDTEVITVGQSYPLSVNTYDYVLHVNPVHMRHLKKDKTYDPARFTVIRDLNHVA